MGFPSRASAYARHPEARSTAATRNRRKAIATIAVMGIAANTPNSITACTGPDMTLDRWLIDSKTSRSASVSVDARNAEAAIATPSAIAATHASDVYRFVTRGALVGRTA